MDIWQKTKEELFLILKYCNLFFHYSRESVLDEFFVLLVMFFCLFVCFRRLTNLHRWMKPSENWKNSKGNYIGVFVLFLFCVCMVFSFCCFVFFSCCCILEQVQTFHRRSRICTIYSWIHLGLLWARANTNMFHFFNVNDPFRKCWSIYLDIRFCMNLTPLERRERIPVNVNLKVLLIGRKNGSS